MGVECNPSFVISKLLSMLVVEGNHISGFEVISCYVLVNVLLLESIVLVFDTDIPVDYLIASYAGSYAIIFSGS